ncbi:unnamed protein product [Rotaria sordida]|uniref:Uncharacterized protein n=1 Tax=Rotaria sordida TaxID=392033 RepID=A0A819UCW1_9BILA|nr:unnamed protein product [Rotaria sordida]CAF4101113.1 unnamed protein product [Rotaria sordida]
MFTVTMIPVIGRLARTYLRRCSASVYVGSIGYLIECVEQIIILEFFFCLFLLDHGDDLQNIIDTQWSK